MSKDIDFDISHKMIIDNFFHLLDLASNTANNVNVTSGAAATSGAQQSSGSGMMSLQAPALVAQLQRNAPNQQLMGGLQQSQQQQTQQQQQYSHQSQQY